MRTYEKHDMTKTPEYTSWRKMKARCYNKKEKSYKNYGGRGIKVCNRWLYSFQNFYEDMGDKPFPRAEIDREKNNSNYEPDNCRWISHTENNHNKRNNVVNWFTVKSIRRLHGMKKYTRKELCIIYNIKLGTMDHIIYNNRWVD